MRSTELFTIGHSTLTADAFVERCTDAGIVTLADIRSIPGSNRNPQFHADALRASLATAGIAYIHLVDLGGRRNRQRAVDPTLNAAWRNRSFRNYADHATTAAFDRGISALLALDGPVAVMCAEALPWRCHRSIVADHLVARGHAVTHLTATTTIAHRPGAWGPEPVVQDTIVTYPTPPTG